jgi:hypothetical protein
MSDRIKYGESIGMGSTPTSPQPTHVAPSTGAISERPEWASGPEWKGWEQHREGTGLKRLGVQRMLGTGLLFIAYPYHLTIYQNDRNLELSQLKPGGSLKIANTIAAESRGWE